MLLHPPPPPPIDCPMQVVEVRRAFGRRARARIGKATDRKQFACSRLHACRPRGNRWQMRLQFRGGRRGAAGLGRVGVRAGEQAGSELGAGWLAGWRAGSKGRLEPVRADDLLRLPGTRPTVCSKLQE